MSESMDTQKPQNTEIIPTPEQCSLWRDGQLIVRLNSNGFGSLNERTPQELIAQAGGTIHHEAPALCAESAFVGTVTGGELIEVAYTMPGGSRRYCYVAWHAAGDTFTTEWWCSDQRLTAEAAYSAIMRARDVKPA